MAKALEDRSGDRREGRWLAPHLRAKAIFALLWPWALACWLWRACFSLDAARQDALTRREPGWWIDAG